MTELQGAMERREDELREEKAKGANLQAELQQMHRLELDKMMATQMDLMSSLSQRQKQVDRLEFELQNAQEIIESEREKIEALNIVKDEGVRQRTSVQVIKG